MQTIGYMLQGVSQQNPKIRQEGCVTEQVNFYSDITRGLTNRPGSQELGGLPQFTPFLTKSHTVRVNGKLYRIALNDGNKPRIFSYEDCSELTVTSSSTANAYVNKNSSVYAYNDTVYLVNRNKVVAQDAALNAAAPSNVVTNWGYITMLGGAFSRKFEVTVSLAATDYTVSFTTPDGTGATDADIASVDNIAKELYDALVLVLPVSFTVSLKQNFIYITCTDPIKNITSRDGDNNLLMIADVAKVELLSGLPKFCAHGALVKVYGSASTADDYWMRFNAGAGATVGANFGDAGVWEEWFDVSQPCFLDVTTMPHKLVIDTVAGTATFSSETWYGRRVGNADTNKAPSFIGTKIGDIAEFQGRLVFCTSGGTVVMSRTSEPMDFFSKSAVTRVVSDPVDIKSSAETTKDFRWMVPFDRDIFVLGDDVQFVISGQNSITPNNASMVVATTFAMTSATRPKSTGRTILIPFTGNRYSGVNEYYASDAYATNSVDNITKTVPRYITGEIIDVSVSPNDGMAIFVTSGSLTTGEVFVYKYVWNGTDKVQSAWCKWKFPGRIKHVFTDYSGIYVWYTVMAFGTPAKETLIHIRMDYPETAALQYNLAVDNWRIVTLVDDGDYLKVVTYHPDAVFIVGTSAGEILAGTAVVPDVIEYIPPVGETDPPVFTYKFLKAVHDGLTVSTVLLAGIAMPRNVVPTRPVPKDYQGKPISTKKLIVSTFYIDYVGSGKIVATMRSKYRGTFEVTSSEQFPTEEITGEWEYIGTTGTLQVPWREFAEYADLDVSSIDAVPTNITEIRYDDAYLKDGV